MGRKANRASQLFQSGPKWKREFVPDHKFDYIDLTEFRTRSCWNYIRYFLMFVAIIISFAAYCADIWSACILLIYNQWSLSTPPKIPLDISKWIFVACIALSFILLAWDIRKARIVMASRDISYAATNSIVFRYMSAKSYNCFSLFMKIQKSRKLSDSAAFYVFFTLKGWKRLLFAEGPRQIIAGITVYAILKTAWTNDQGGFQFDNNMDKYGKDWQQVSALCLMGFTCLVWVLNVLNLLCAIILYIPVFCQIQGNLKEYCCHKIDKRITEVLEKQRRKRLRGQDMKASNSKYRKHSDSGNEYGGDSLAAKPTLPTMTNDLYNDKRPLHDDYYDYPSDTYVMSEPTTPYQHHHLASPAPVRAYTQPTPYNVYHQEDASHSDYFDNASYYSSPQPPQPQPVQRYNTDSSTKYDYASPSFAHTIASPYTPYSDTPTMVASPAPYSAHIASPYQASPRYQTQSSPYSHHPSVRSPPRQ